MYTNMKVPSFEGRGQLGDPRCVVAAETPTSYLDRDQYGLEVSRDDGSGESITACGHTWWDTGATFGAGLETYLLIQSRVEKLDVHETSTIQ